MVLYDNLSSHTAEDYDNNIRNTIPFYDSIHNLVFELVKVLKPVPKLWLDTGCGTGTFVNRASEIFPSTSFVLSDPSEAMLAEAKSKLEKVPSKQLTILSPNTTQNIQWDGKPFDIITALMSHHYLTFEERSKATKNCYNHLRAGGIYITFENITPQTTIGIETGLNMWKEYQLSRGKSKDEVTKHIRRFGVELLPITIKKHLEILDNCDFSTIELFWFSYMQAGFYAIK